MRPLGSMSLLATAGLALLACLAPRSAAAQGVAMPASVGINVGSVDDWAVESFFVDVMKASRHWGSVGSPWDEAASVDAAGWPTQDAGVVVLTEIEDGNGNSLLTGAYSLSFQGEAQISFVACSGTVTNQIYNAATNTTTATLTLANSGGGTQLMLGFANTQRTAQSPVGSGVTDVVLRRPQLAPNGKAWWRSQSQIFTTPFLNLVSPYSTLRFMDFTATNGNTVIDWSSRTTPQSASQQTANGAAWEYVIDLANTVHRDIWINVPAEANSAYISQLAKLMYRKLDSGLNIYLEYSNEVWNWEFAQATYNQNAANAEVAANPNSPLALGCALESQCEYIWGDRRIARADIEIGQTFKSVFGTQANRIRPIFATQLGQTYYVANAMTMIVPVYGPPANNLYALAEAPYWAGDNSIDGLTTQQELQNSAAALTAVTPDILAFTTYATYWGLRSVTYEGGPGMSGTQSLTSKIDANRTAQMGGQVTTALQTAFADGTTMYMYYNDAGEYGQYGMWGTTEDVFDGATHKISAINGVLAAGSVPITGGAVLPATIAGGYPGIASGSYWTVTGNGYVFLNPGASAGYLINVPVSGTYPVSLSVLNYGDATSGTLQVDQSVAGGITIPTTGGAFVSTPQASVALTAGLHVLSINAPNLGFGIATVTAGSP